MRQYPRKNRAHAVAQLVQVQCKVHQQMIIWSGNLGRLSKSEKVSFQMLTERTMLFNYLTCSRSEFQRVGTVTEKA